MDYIGFELGEDGSNPRHPTHGDPDIAVPHYRDSSHPDDGGSLNDVRSQLKG
ncbi:hypothetical protein GCM10025779_09420 [Arthrobacter cryoconiti]